MDEAGRGFDTEDRIEVELKDDGLKGLHMGTGAVIAAEEGEGMGIGIGIGKRDWSCL